MKLNNISYETKRELSKEVTITSSEIQRDGTFNIEAPENELLPQLFSQRYIEAMPAVQEFQKDDAISSVGDVLFAIEHNEPQQASLISLEPDGIISQELLPARIEIRDSVAELIDFDLQSKQLSVIDHMDLLTEDGKERFELNLELLGPVAKVDPSFIQDAIFDENRYKQFQAFYYEKQNLYLEAQKEETLAKDAADKFQKEYGPGLELSSSGDIELRLPESDTIVSTEIAKESNGSYNPEKLLSFISEREAAWDMHIVPSEADGRTAAKVSTAVENRVKDEIHREQTLPTYLDQNHDGIDDRIQDWDKDGDGIDDQLEEGFEEDDDFGFEHSLWDDND